MTGRSRRGEVGQVGRGEEWERWEEEESGTGGRVEDWERWEEAESGTGVRVEVWVDHVCSLQPMAGNCGSQRELLAPDPGHNHSLRTICHASKPLGSSVSTKKEATSRKTSKCRHFHYISKPNVCTYQQSVVQNSKLNSVFCKCFKKKVRCIF